METLSTIEVKISTAQRRSEALVNDDMSWQEKVDDLLDRMNHLNKGLSRLQEILMNITFEIERDLSSFKESNIASEGITKITSITARFLSLVRKSDLFPGVKSTYYLLKHENAYLRELVADRKISLELDQDEEMMKIMKESSKLVTKKAKRK